MTEQIEQDSTLNLLEEQIDMLVDDSKLTDVVTALSEDTTAE
jgi:hypothetical protein